MSYTTDDFAESLCRVDVAPKDIAAVVAAWGAGEGMGDDAGHFKWSADGATEWAGGFLLHLHDGRYAYLTGWCDYTGWGCQDGAELHYFDARPSVEELKAKSEYHAEPDADQWDIEPSDLNRWLQSPETTNA